MRFTRIIPFIAVLVCVSVGCAVQTKSRMEADARAYSAVAASEPTFRPAIGDPIAWFGAPIWADASLQKNNEALGLEIQDAVTRQLLNRGFKIVNEVALAKYVIGLGIITPGGERSEELAGFFQVFPQLPRSAAGFDRGMIVAGIIVAEDVGTAGTAPDRRAVLWRSGIEAFVLGKKLDNAAHLQRIDKLASVLTSSIHR